MRKLLVSLLMISVLTGCSVEKVEKVDNLTESTVIDKHKDGYGGRYGYDYFVTVEKNKQSLVLEIDPDTYKMIKKGVVVSGYYDEDGYFSNISFPKISENPIDKTQK